MYTFMQWKDYVHIKRNDDTSYKTQKIFSAFFYVSPYYPPSKFVNRFNFHKKMIKCKHVFSE